MKLETKGYQGPITALVASVIGENTVVLWAEGGFLHYKQETSIQLEGKIRLFDHSIIHGIRLNPLCSSEILVFGEKSAALLRFDFDNTVIIGKEESLDDWVLDASFVQTSLQQYTICLGYAHNFVDLIRISVGSLLFTKISRFSCEDVVVLFALSFSVINETEILVASGNVFGKLNIWKLSTLEPSCTVPVLTSIHEHEGVIFRIVWHKNRSQIITVSDDRTVRLWGFEFQEGINTSQLKSLFVGWGHVSRVWDALFLEGSIAQNCQIASCSEDGTIKLWNISESKSIVSLVGHIGNVWRLVQSPDNLSLISGGNDSSIKFYPISYHQSTSPEDPASTIRHEIIPSDTPAEDSEEKFCADLSRRNNGVSALRLSSCGNYAIIALISGRIWFVHLHKDTLSVKKWYVLHETGENIMGMDALFSEDKSNESVEIAISTVSCHILYLNFTIQHILANESNELLVEKSEEFTWKPHDRKTVNLWLFKTKEANSTNLLTSTTKGFNTLWQLTSQPIKIMNFKNGKEEITTSLLYKNISAYNLSFLMLGDSRGGVSVFPLNVIPEEPETPLNPIQYFRNIHISDPVSTLCNIKQGFISVGHNNMMNFYIYHPPIDKLDPFGTWVHQNSLSTLPIHTPDQIYIFDDNEDSIAEASIYICGYHGSSYMVYDIRRNYQIMKIEGGGWKRPHQSILIPSSNDRNRLPSVLFACPAPIGKRDTELQLFGSPMTSALDQHVQSIPVQLGCSGFGKVTYCSTIVRYFSKLDNQYYSYLLAGGEDCIIKAFSLPSLDLVQESTLSKNSSLKSLANASSPTEERGLVLGGGGKLLYYIWIYDFSDISQQSKHHLAPFRKVRVGNLLANASQDHRILSVNAMYLDSSKISSSHEEYLLFLSDSRGFISIFYYSYHYHWYRHPDVKSMYHPPPVPCDQLTIAYQLEISNCPILSSSLSSLNFMDKTTGRIQYYAQSTQHSPDNSEEIIDHQLVLFACGDTKGDAYTGVITLSRASSALVWSITNQEIFNTSSLHEMGTNSISIRSFPSSIETMDLSSPVTWTYFLCSAGDDQAISIEKSSITLQNKDNLLGIQHSHSILVNRHLASCTAFKGIDILSLSNNPSLSSDYQVEFATVACDQRFSVWRLNGKSTESFEDVKLDWLCGQVSFVTEMGGLFCQKVSYNRLINSNHEDSMNNHQAFPLQYDCIVIGEGIHYIQLTN